MPLQFELPLLHSYWVSFKWPKPPEGIIQIDSLPKGFGITAFSKEDALNILAQNGCASYLGNAEEENWIEITEMTQFDQKHVLPNAGPMYFRGLWYPSLNTGFETPNK